MSCILSQDLKVSIITVCYNCENLIEKTIESVIFQSYPNIQYIVIDGGSTDGTLDVIEKYSSHIDTLISEKDNGIYYAMNKGITHANGDIIYFLNSGDFLYNNNVIEIICTKFNQFPDSDIIYGDAILFDENSSQRLSLYRPTPLHVLTRCGICHQSLFAKRSLFNSSEPFNTEYHIYADYEWLLRSIILEKCHLQYFNTPVVYYMMGGLSQKDPSHYYHERIEIMNTYMQYLNKWDLATSYPREIISYRILVRYLQKSSSSSIHSRMFLQNFEITVLSALLRLFQSEISFDGEIKSD